MMPLKAKKSNAFEIMTIVGFPSDSRRLRLAVLACALFTRRKFPSDIKKNWITHA